MSRPNSNLRPDESRMRQRRELANTWNPHGVCSQRVTNSLPFRLGSYVAAELVQSGHLNATRVSSHKSSQPQLEEGPKLCP